MKRDRPSETILVDLDGVRTVEGGRDAHAGSAWVSADFRFGRPHYPLRSVAKFAANTPALLLAVNHAMGRFLWFGIASYRLIERPRVACRDCRQAISGIVAD